MSKKLSNFDTMSTDELQIYLQKELKDICYDLDIVRRDTKLIRRKLYLAGPWFDDKAMLLMNAVKKVVELLGDKCWYDVFFPMDQQEQSPLDVYTNNVTKIQGCDTLLALISRKDVGTAYEIGLADAMGKGIVLLGLDETCFDSKTNVMLAFCSDRCFTFKNIVKFLCSEYGREDCVVILNEWEGKE